MRLAAAPHSEPSALQLGRIPDTLPGHQWEVTVQFEITDPYFEELKKRRRRGEIELLEERGARTAKATKPQ